MVNNWKSWCRLCAQEDPTKTNINIKLKDEIESTFLDAISKHFTIDINLKDWPDTICTRCFQYVTDLVHFIHRTSKVQTMFAELYYSNHEELNLKELRTKYELYELKDVKLIVNDPPIPKIGEFEFIDEDMLATPDIKTERIDNEDEEDDEDSVTSDKDWQPEKDFDSLEGDGNDMVKTKREKEEDDEDDDDNDNDNEDSEEGQKSNKQRKPKKQPKLFTCSTCQKEFCSYAKYSRHTLKEHGITAEPLPFVCGRCNKSFFTQKACDKHEKTHESAQQKLTICPYCNQEFHKNKLRGHIREAHVGARPYICEDCGKAYTTFGNLKEHKLTHSDEKPFKCRFCEKCFKNKPRLRTHEDTHNDTNYICTSCGLKLNTRRTLNMHMLVHSDQKEHKCEYCGKAYKRAKNLKIHLIMHTGLKSYYCTFCDKSFTCNANCRVHMKKIHPVELAEKEAGGKKLSNANIPKLEDLRAVISKKAANPMAPLEFKSTPAGIVPVTDALKTMRAENQAMESKLQAGILSMNEALKSTIRAADDQAMELKSNLGMVAMNDSLKTLRVENQVIDFKSHGIISMNDNMKVMRVENQTTMMAPQNEEETISQEQNSYFVHNRLGYGQLHAS